MDLPDFIRKLTWVIMSFIIIDLSDCDPEQLEQLGTKTKFWYNDEQGKRRLFKEGRPGTGENWAEKVCCELCALLNIPHAQYELAVWKNQRKGIVSPTFVPEGGRLILGNELLAKVVKDYDDTRRYRLRQHTIRIVMAVAASEGIDFPIGWKPPKEVADAAGVMAGYLMLDALVSNQDRHHENWGLVSVPEKGIFLAPTFDHASSLGRNETDVSRIERLQTKDSGRSVESYVARAKSAFYLSNTNAHPLSTLDAFVEAAKLRQEAARYWLDMLTRLDLADFEAILSRVPDTEISQPAREFACRMLELNRKRLLEVDY